MKITEKLKTKIEDIAASHFLSEGDYSDLLEASEGDEKAKQRVAIWEPLENKDYGEILECVNNLIGDISKLIEGL